MTSRVSVPTSILAWGLARRLWYQSGFVSAPALDAKTAKLMLAESAERAFSRAGWLFEPKLDGYRVLAARQSGDARLLTRNANDYTEAFPEITRAVAALPFDRVLLDHAVACGARLRQPVAVTRVDLDVERPVIEQNSPAFTLNPTSNRTCVGGLLKDLLMPIASSILFSRSQNVDGTKSSRRAGR